MAGALARLSREAPSGPDSDHLQRPVRFRRHLDGDWVAGFDVATGLDYRHDARLPDERPPLITLQHRSQQSGVELVQLYAGIAQARNCDDGRIADMQARPGGKPQQIHPARGNIFAHLPGAHGKTGSMERIMQFRMDQVDLTQVGLGRVTRHPRAMLDPLAAMRVALNSQSPEESNAPLSRFGKRVRWAAAHGEDGSTHQPMPLSRG